jgi:methyl-accepting chemotaxis protein
VGFSYKVFIIRDKLKKTITDINNEHLGQKNISGNLRISIQESSGGLGIIAENMLSVKNKTNIQKDSVMQTADSVEGIVNHIHYLEGAVDIQAETIAQSSGLIEQMVGGINEVRAVVRRADETTENLSKSSDASHKMLKILTEEIKSMRNGIKTMDSMFAEVTDMQASLYLPKPNLPFLRQAYKVVQSLAA